jgi:hypothetical protein
MNVGKCYENFKNRRGIPNSLRIKKVLPRNDNVLQSGLLENIKR